MRLKLNKKSEQSNQEKQLNPKRGFFYNFIWLPLVAYTMMIGGQVLGSVLTAFSNAFEDNGYVSLLFMYLVFIGIWIVCLVTMRKKEYKPMLNSATTKLKGNNLKNLILGLALGLGFNSLCIFMAYMNNDFKLSFSSFNILLLLLMFVAVFIQSSAEEMVARNYVFNKVLSNRKSIVLAFLVNSYFFACMHLGNTGITWLALINLFLVGILTTEFVYYLDSLWAAFSFHAAWNFSQNIIFGLPNSGNESTYGIFKCDLASVKSSFFYDSVFGVEGSIFATIVLAIACVVIYTWGKRKGIKESLKVWIEYEKEYFANNDTTKKKKSVLKRIFKFIIVIIAIYFTAVQLLVDAQGFAPKVYVITTGKVINWEGIDKTNVESTMGVENTEENFKLYFQWYNILHETGHAVMVYNAGSDLKLTNAEVEQLANDFAVAYWDLYGESDKLAKLKEITEYAKNNIKTDIPEGTDHMKYANEHWEDEDFIEKYEHYGWFQFNSSYKASHNPKTLEQVFEEMKIVNYSVPKNINVVEYGEITEESSTKMLEDAFENLKSWGLNMPDRVEHNYNEDPNANFSNPYSVFFDLIYSLDQKAILKNQSMIVQE